MGEEESLASRQREVREGEVMEETEVAEGAWVVEMGLRAEELGAKV